MQSVIQELTDICKEVFDDADIVLTSETTANDIEGWDSFGHMNLILALEVKYQIKFSQKDIYSFDNVGELADYIQKKVENK